MGHKESEKREKGRSCVVFFVQEYTFSGLMRTDKKNLNMPNLYSSYCHCEIIMNRFDYYGFISVDDITR